MTPAPPGPSIASRHHYGSPRVSTEPRANHGAYWAACVVVLLAPLARANIAAAERLDVEKLVKRIPRFGFRAYRAARKLEEGLKNLLIPGMLSYKLLLSLVSLAPEIGSFTIG